MRKGSSLRGFSVGVLVGVLVGSAGMASATFGLKGWSRFTEDFRNGYINGFLDMSNLARNLEPGGWVDERYPYFPQVKPQEWRGVIDKLYQDPANKDYLITSMIQLASKTMEGRYGKPTDPAVRAKARMDAQMAALRAKYAKQAADAAAAAAASAPAPAGTPAPAASAPAPAPASAAGGKVQIDHKTSQRKWCRCDGTDPKAARAQRRAAAEAEDETRSAGLSDPAKAAKPAAKAAEPSAKTPPAAAKTK